MAQDTSLAGMIEGLEPAASDAVAPAASVPEVAPVTTLVVEATQGDAPAGDALAGDALALEIIEAVDIQQKGLGEVIEQLLAFSGTGTVITRKAWAGVKRPTAIQFRGIRYGLRQLGFEIVDKEVRPGKSSLSSAVYSDGEHRLKVEYGAAENFHHIARPL